MPVGQHAERALVQVHDGEVVSLVAVDDGVGVQSHHQVVPESSCGLEEVEMADMKEVESAGYVDNPVSGSRLAGVGELGDLLRGRQEVGDTGPGRASVGVGR